MGESDQNLTFIEIMPRRSRSSDCFKTRSTGSDAASFVCNAARTHHPCIHDCDADERHRRSDDGEQIGQL